MRTSIRIVVPCALVLGFAAGAAQAQHSYGPADNRETWTEASRTQVWKNGFGECWHSAFGPPPPPALCGTPVAAVVVPVVAPVVIAPPAQLPPKPMVSAAPAPAPAPYVAPREPKRDRN